LTAVRDVVIDTDVVSLLQKHQAPSSGGVQRGAHRNVPGRKTDLKTR